MSGYYFPPDDGRGLIPVAASVAVLGTAACRLLAGYVADGVEHECCRIATSCRRLCWHQAAVILAANGLHAEPARPVEVEAQGVLL